MSEQKDCPVKGCMRVAHDDDTGCLFEGDVTPRGPALTLLPSSDLATLRSEHQRVQAERDEARAEAAAMRRALEEYDAKLRDVWGKEDDPYAVAYGWSKIKREAALSSSAGAALLEEVEGLRRANAAMAARLAPDWSRWIGPCVHGRDPWDRCDTCEEAGEAQSIVWVLDKERKEHAAESADLRARLERAEGRKDRWRMVARRRLKQAQHRESIIEAFFAGEFACVDCGVPTNNGRCYDCMNGNTPAAKTAAEVRRAVEEETERISTMLRARASEWGADTAVGHALEVAASAIRARGKGVGCG